LDGVGPVVLAGLPDDRVGVVLVCVVDGHPDSEGERGFAVANGLAAVGVVLVVGDPELGVELVEGLLGGAVRGRVARSGLPSGQVRTWGWSLPGAARCSIRLESEDPGCGI
jgi:hypothetical protein